MPGQYSTPCGCRPWPREREPSSARLFLCARCRAQVLVCSHCDRGQIYCAQGCGQTARREAQRAAGRRYQASRRGRLNHAARASRYRARQKNVTHQGSLPPVTNDLVAVGASVSASEPVSACGPCCRGRSRGDYHRSWHCHWCGCRCSPFVRHAFLRRHAGASRRPTSPRMRS